MMDKQNIALVGFMGTGKSTVGRLLAAKLGWDFLDGDECVETAECMTIPELFAQKGEEYFRDAESRAIAAFAAKKRHVLATGGGAILRAGNLALLESSSWLICLTARPETILARTGKGSGRPLLEADDALLRIKSLLQKREAAYAKVSWHVATDGREPLIIADEILAWLGREVWKETP